MSNGLWARPRLEHLQPRVTQSGCAGSTRQRQRCKLLEHVVGWLQTERKHDDSALALAGDQITRRTAGPFHEDRLVANIGELGARGIDCLWHGRYFRRIV